MGKCKNNNLLWLDSLNKVLRFWIELKVPCQFWRKEWYFVRHSTVGESWEFWLAGVWHERLSKRLEYTTWQILSVWASYTYWLCNSHRENTGHHTLNDWSLWPSYTTRFSMKSVNSNLQIGSEFWSLASTSPDCKSEKNLTSSSSAVGNAARTIYRGIIKNAWISDGEVGSAWGMRQLEGREPGDTLTGAERNSSISDACRDLAWRDAALRVSGLDCLMS